MMNETIRIATALTVAALASACGSVSYKPVQQTGFDLLVDQGCGRSDQRFTVSAHVNSASREAIVLWDGRDGSRTVAVTLPKPGIGTRLRGVFGKNRYELGYERLDALRVSGEPLDLTMNCDGQERAPVADRFTYLEQGQRVEFEF